MSFLFVFSLTYLVLNFLSTNVCVCFLSFSLFSYMLPNLLVNHIIVVVGLVR